MLGENEGRDLLRQTFEESYFDFFWYFWDTIVEDPFVPNWHIALICQELQALGERIRDRQPKAYDLIINVPPGSSKSMMATVMFPVWLWTIDPTIRIISGSHSGSLSLGHSSLARDVLASDKFQYLYGHEVEIRKDMDSKGYYKNTHTGSRRSTSSGSKITGEHAHLLLIDDPIDPEGVVSTAIMERTHRWMNQTLPSRVVEKKLTPMVLIMQRLHRADPTGVMLQQAEESAPFNVRQICLPATDEYPFTPADQVVRFNGEERTVAEWYAHGGGFLDPIRMGATVLEQFKIKLGSAGYAGQFGQNPRATEGNLVKKGMLPVIDWHQVPREALRKVRDFTVDSADKTKRTNDYSGFLCYTEFKGYVFLFNYLDVKERFSQRVRMLRDFIETNGSPQSRVYIEPKSSGPAIIQFMQDHTQINVLEWVMAEGDKVARLNSIMPFLEARRVVLVKGPWNDEFINNVLSFQGRQVDKAEEVDTLVMACINVFLRKSSTGYRLHI